MQSTSSFYRSNCLVIDQSAYSPFLSRDSFTNSSVLHPLHKVRVPGFIKAYPNPPSRQLTPAEQLQRDYDYMLQDLFNELTLLCDKKRQFGSQIPQKQEEHVARLSNMHMHALILEAQKITDDINKIIESNNEIPYVNISHSLNSQNGKDDPSTLVIPGTSDELRRFRYGINQYCQTEVYVQPYREIQAAIQLKQQRINKLIRDISQLRVNEHGESYTICEYILYSIRVSTYGTGPAD